MKLCIDCKHHTHNKAPEYALCGRIVSQIHGGPTKFCEFERRDYKACGPDARHFEPRPMPQRRPWWRCW
jgi:hypothetical protein